MAKAPVKSPTALSAGAPAPWGGARLIEAIPQRILSGQSNIFHADEVSGCPGLLEGFRHDKGNRLAIVRHLRTGEHWMSLMVIARALLRCVLVGQHQKHAGRPLRRVRVDGFYLPLADGGFDDKAVGHPGTVLHLIRITRAARDLQPSVDTIERLAE